jgi:hypothetical protein
LQTGEVKRKLAIQGLFPVGICGEDFADLVRKRDDDLGRAIKELRLKAE